MRAIVDWLMWQPIGWFSLIFIYILVPAYICVFFLTFSSFVHKQVWAITFLFYSVLLLVLFIFSAKFLQLCAKCVCWYTTIFIFCALLPKYKMQCAWHPDMFVSVGAMGNQYLSSLLLHDRFCISFCLFQIFHYDFGAAGFFSLVFVFCFYVSQSFFPSSYEPFFTFLFILVFFSVFFVFSVFVFFLCLEFALLYRICVRWTHSR